jgi:alpha-1,3-rhamnosyl/mannosyltransferase
VDPPYLLIVGEYEARKGYPEAFEVIGRLAAHGLPHELLVAGAIAPWRKSTIEGLVNAAAAPDRISLLGRVSDTRLLELYRGAAITLVTSRMEGFGLPALEAMACGCPVVAFSNSAIAEVVGEGGVLVPDSDVTAMAAAARELLTDDLAWREASAAAVKRAAAFSWAECAAAHAEILLDAAR